MSHWYGVYAHCVYTALHAICSLSFCRLGLAPLGLFLLYIGAFIVFVCFVLCTFYPKL